MHVVKSDRVYYFDVDDTLVYWKPRTSEHSASVHVKSEHIHAYINPNREMIAQMIQHCARGHSVVVWSRGGWQWAEAVVKALDIECYVTAVMSKPEGYYDDIPASEFMGKPMYVGIRPE